MNPVGELLGIEDIELDPEVSSKEALRSRIAAMLARPRRLAEAEVLDSLTTREQLGSTAVGHGIAIPHARMTQCGAAAGAFLRTKAAMPSMRPMASQFRFFSG